MFPCGLSHKNLFLLCCSESLAGAAMGGGGAGKDDNSLIRTPTPSTSDSEAGSGDPMRSALALVQQMEAKAITDGAEARAEPSKAQDPSKQAAGGAAGQGSTSRRNMPGTTGTTGTTGTAKATSGHSGDDEYSDGDAYEFVDELEEDGSGSDGARPWSQTYVRWGCTVASSFVAVVCLFWSCCFVHRMSRQRFRKTNDGIGPAFDAKISA